MKHALIYGSCTGMTEEVAEQVAEALKPEFLLKLMDVGSVEACRLADWELLFCGIPTWDVGELEYGWQSLYDDLNAVRLDGVTVVMFGLGDQHGYPETYQDAMGILYRKLLERGARGGIGFTSTRGHTFKSSRGVVDGRFCGLAIDEDGQPELTQNRIRTWAVDVKRELKFLLSAKA